MTYIIIRVILIAFALVLAASFIPGIAIAGLYSALIAAAILGLLNAIVRPVLVVLTLPITLLTLGLFVFVINALLFWFAASFIDGFTVMGFWPAFFGSLVVSLVSVVSNQFLKST